MPASRHTGDPGRRGRWVTADNAGSHGAKVHTKCAGQTAHTWGPCGNMGVPKGQHNRLTAKVQSGNDHSHQGRPTRGFILFT